MIFNSDSCESKCRRKKEIAAAARVGCERANKGRRRKEKERRNNKKCGALPALLA
jgi:hypothetical protein